MESSFKDEPKTTVEETRPLSPSAKERKIKEIVDRWWNTHIRGSAVAEHGAGWNHLTASLAHLIKDLKTEL